MVQLDWITHTLFIIHTYRHICRGAQLSILDNDGYMSS